MFDIGLRILTFGSVFSWSRYAVFAKLLGAMGRAVAYVGAVGMNLDQIRQICRSGRPSASASRA